MKKRTPVGLISLSLCFALLFGTLTGCGQSEGSDPDDKNDPTPSETISDTTDDKVPSDEPDDKDPSKEPDDFDEGEGEELSFEGGVIHTDYGDLFYPENWQGSVIIRLVQRSESIAVIFEMESDGNVYELFRIVIGRDDGIMVGVLTDDAGAIRNVYLYAEELASDSGLEGSEQLRYYAMQEDLNYLINNLK